MSSDLDRLRDLLKSSDAKVTKKLREHQAQPLREGELARLEAELLAHAPDKSEVPELLDLVRRVAIELGTSQRVLSEQRLIVRHPLPRNPFGEGFHEAEENIEDTANWLSRTKALPISPGLALFRFLVAAILEFRILHVDYIPAVLRSIREGRNMTLHPRIVAIPLSLNYGRQENAERRLLILRQESVCLFGEFLDMAGALTYVDTILLKRNHKAILAAIEGGVPDPSSKSVHSGAQPTLSKLIEHACTMAMLKLPSVIVAHRSRQIVSHSLPPEQLGRIMKKGLDPFARPLNRLHESSGIPDDPDADLPTAMDDDPAWIKKLRDALNENGLDHALLKGLMADPEPNAGLLAGFAQFLEKPSASGKSSKSSKGCEPETVRRYCLLIATKLIPRVPKSVPKITSDAWEDAIEQTLDEDAFYNLERYSAQPNSKAQTHSRPLIKAIRHWLRFLAERVSRNSNASADETQTVRVKQLSDLEKRLPILGLVAVDASLITVEEYRCALGRLVGKHRGGTQHDREAIRVALILGYRCGLRRMESAGLRIGDFDNIDFLHLTPNKMRALKTSNAKRDLPLRLLIPGDELGHLQRRVRDIYKRAKSQYMRLKFPKERPEDAFLFSDFENPYRTIDFEQVVGWISRAFHGDQDRGWWPPIDPQFHYHRLRHSCCSVLLLKLWEDLRRMAPHIMNRQRHAQTLQWIGDGAFRESLFGTNRVIESDIQAISVLMGHGAGAVSLEHYIHVLDWYEIPDTWSKDESAEAVST